MKQNQHQQHKYNEKLPVFKFKDKIISTIKNNSITLIVGETGSGKTTQIPQYLFEWIEVSPTNKIICTQPRTIAAKSVAERVSYENCGKYNQCGNIIGYHIRLDNKINNNITKLIYMTEGVLLRKAMNDNLFSGYKVIIIDEAHERTVNADLLMGFLKNIIQKRKDLRLVIMSATLDIKRFTKYFNVNKNKILQIPGSVHPVEHYWLSQPTDNYINLVKQVINAIHENISAYQLCGKQKKPDGHILVFLTGQQEIDNVVREFTYNKNGCLNNHIYGFDLEVYPLYAALRHDERQKAFDEPNNIKTRKCVVSTNIAETSLTISNIMYVIDCGLSKQKIYSSSKGVEALGVKCISKASVKQRIGRAGRVKPGKAYHLYTKLGYEKFPTETTAEIIRSGLVSETLSMLALGINNPLQFDFIDAPDEMTMARAINRLYNLGAINNNGKITKFGLKMAKFPLKPELSASILKSYQFNCCYEIIIIASMLEIYDRLWRKPSDNQKFDIKLKKKQFYHISGDHITLLNIFNAYKKIKISSIDNNNNNLYEFCKNNYWELSALDRADQIKKQLEQILSQIKLNELNKQNNNNNNNLITFKLNDHRYKGYYDNIIKCLLCGYFMNIAVQGFGGKYWTFRILTLSENNNDKCIDVIDKASMHPSSMFYKNVSRNWIIYHEIQISHTTQLKIITAIKPIWLIQTNNKYYNINSLKNDKSPIAEILIASAESVKN